MPTVYQAPSPLSIWKYGNILILLLPSTRHSSILGSMNKLSLERRAAIVRCLVEGNSIRSTVRMTGAAKNTVAKLLVDLGEACWEYQDGALRGIASQRVQSDEIWSFVGCKQNNLPAEERGAGEGREAGTGGGLMADGARGPDAPQS